MIIAATKPEGTIAKKLVEMGIEVISVEEDEGNVDRYVLSTNVIVDRRTGSSFPRGIIDKTLFTSAVYMREHYKIPVLVNEGQIDYRYMGINPQAVRGALSALMLLYEVNVVSTPDTDETAHLIAMMARQEQTGIPDISLIPKRKATSLDDRQSRVMEMLPGCGMVKARELLQHFGSIRRIVEAGDDELSAFKGFGRKKVKEIRKVLSAEYEGIDTERDIENALVYDPKLLFPSALPLVARQHVIFDDKKGKHVVDLVYHERMSSELILVELKRGRVRQEHVAQIARYIDRASDSPLLRGYQKRGCTIRGLLATVEECSLKIKRRDVSLRVIDRNAVIRALKSLRRERLAVEAPGDEK